MAECERGTGNAFFTLRLWRERLADNQFEWRGELRSIPDGHTHYFRGWSGLLALLKTALAGYGVRDENSHESNS